MRVVSDKKNVVGAVRLPLELAMGLDLSETPLPKAVSELEFRYRRSWLNLLSWGYREGIRDTVVIRTDDVCSTKGNPHPTSSAVENGP